MAAAAFKVSMTIKNTAGQTKNMYWAASDVNAAGWTAESAGTELQLSKYDAYITDLVLSAAGTDTTTTSVYINGIYSGYRIIHAANVYSVLTRQVQSAPIFVPAGALVKFIQNT